MVDLNGIKNETKRNHAEKVLNGHELECYEDLNLDYVNEFCAQRNLKMTLQVLLFPDSTPTGLIRCSLCDGAFRSRNGHPWFNGSDRNRYVIKKQLIDNHLKYYHTSKEEKKRARQAAASSSLTLDNTILGGDILETFNNVLTERDDLLQILKENNVPAPSKGIPGLIIQAYLVLSRLFDLDLLEPLSDRGVDGFYQNSIETPSSTDIQLVETEVKLEPVVSDTEVFTETVRFSDESDDDEECDDEGGGEEEEHFDLDSDFLSEDEFFAPSKKKRRKYTNHNYDEKLKSVTPEQTSALQTAFDACVCLTRSVEKELIESTKLEGGLISAWYRAKRKSLSPEQKESARNEMIKLRAKETVQCPQCDKTVTKAYLKLHIQRVHEGGVAGKSRTSPKTPKARKPKPTFPCPQCDRILKTKSSLKNHIKVVHDDQTVTCDQCGKTVRNNEALKHHMRMYHVEKRFVCDICDFRATHQCKLDLHRLKHFPNLMPFKCDFCSYATTEKRNLEAHVRKHTGEKPFQCDQCEFRCARKDYLQSHIICNHTDERPFKCDQCDKRFKFKGKLDHHKKNHLGLKPYHCDMCDFKTAHKYNLQSHFNTIHLGIKNNQCNYCEKAFNKKGDLVKHVEQVHQNVAAPFTSVAQQLSLQ